MGLVYDLVSVMEFLDGMIEANKAWQAAAVFNSKIQAIGGPIPEEIYLRDGVECFADILQVELSERRFPTKTGMVGVRKSFKYKGYEVLQIKEEPAGGVDE